MVPKQGSDAQSMRNALRAGDNTELDRRGGASPLSQGLLLCALLVAGWQATALIPEPSVRAVLGSRWPLWVPFSLLAFWRWGWAVLHWIRAAIYRLVIFPRRRAQATQAWAQRGPVRELSIVLATFRERPEITRRVIASLGKALDQLPDLARPPLLIAVTGSDEDDAEIRKTFHECLAGLQHNRNAQLKVLRGDRGKRDALAVGLKALVEWGPDPEGVFVMMDGDTELEPQALLKLLPLFYLEPRFAAITTNEHAHVQAPGWFAEWIHLRHGQRHLYNCSLALSNKLLCLTGRCSIFRASCLDPAFIATVNGDRVEHWLWGRYALLSGDDKSTWFCLLSRGQPLLYAPDVSVITHERVGDNAWLRAYHNLRRWGGNMVRNSERAIRIGPRRLGFFCWWCLVDQRLSMWTTLVGPTAMIFAVGQGNLSLIAAYGAWLLLSRTARSVPAWVHGRRFSAYYTLCAIVFDWMGAVIKIWVCFFPARQFWHNRGGRELDTTRGRRRTMERRLVAAIMLASIVAVYFVTVGDLVGATGFFADLGFMWAELRRSPRRLFVMATLVLLLTAYLTRAAAGDAERREEAT